MSDALEVKRVEQGHTMGSPTGSLGGGSLTGGSEVVTCILGFLGFACFVGILLAATLN